MRMTRAAMRAQAPGEEMTIHEDASALQEQELPETEQTERPALRDVTDGNSSTADEHTDTKPMPKKAKSRKKADTAVTEKMEDVEHTLDMPDSQQQEQTNKTEPLLLSQLPLPVIAEPDQLDQDLASTPATAAPEQSISETIYETTQTPHRQPMPLSKTPKFDPQLHLPTNTATDNTPETTEDSFVDSIKSRSPSKLSRESAEPDSFVEQITSRTSARRVSRFEDSVEAMDALEDAIEEVSTSLPELEHMDVESPVKARKQSPAKPTPSPVRKQSPTKATPSAVRKTALDTTIAARTPRSTRPSPSKVSLAKPSPTKSKTAQLKAAPSRTTSGRVSTVKPTSKAPTITKSTSRPSNIPPKVAPNDTSESESRPQMSFSGSPAKQQPNVMKKRMTSGPLSTSKAAFVPTKSSKPPTTSNFTLPGEAIAAKLKAQREERAKKEEEDAKKPAFKARPAPPKASRPSVIPRETRANQARTSAIRTGSNKENVAPRSVPSTVGKPSDGINVAKTRSDAKANSAVRRTTVAPRASLAPRIASQSAGERLEVTKEDAVQQKIKGKEVFGRARAEKAAADMEKREKEEAAKKARADAAERGRQASRQWAEKQKRKLEMQKAAKPAIGGSPAPASVAAAT